jgi:hypothetical protein
MSNYLVTFPDGYSTLFTERVAAEQAVAYWPHDPPVIRDLDQEARYRDEMIGLLLRFDGPDRLGCLDDVRALLKRLGRLP